MARYRIWFVERIPQYFKASLNIITNSRDGYNRCLTDLNVNYSRVNFFETRYRPKYYSLQRFPKLPKFVKHKDGLSLINKFLI